MAQLSPGVTGWGSLGIIMFNFKLSAAFNIKSLMMLFKCYATHLLLYVVLRT